MRLGAGNMWYINVIYTMRLGAGKYDSSPAWAPSASQPPRRTIYIKNPDVLGTEYRYRWLTVYLQQPVPSTNPFST